MSLQITLLWIGIVFMRIRIRILPQFLYDQGNFLLLFAATPVNTVLSYSPLSYQVVFMLIRNWILPQFFHTSGHFLLYSQQPQLTMFYLLRLYLIHSDTERFWIDRRTFLVDRNKIFWIFDAHFPCRHSRGHCAIMVFSR